MNLTKEQALAMDKYELAAYVGKHELKNGRVEQEVLIDPVKAYNDGINTQLDECSSPPDFLKLWYRYEKEHNNTAFVRNYVKRIDTVLIADSKNKQDLKDIWDMFPDLQEDINFKTVLQKRKKELGL